MRVWDLIPTLRDKTRIFTEPRNILDRSLTSSVSFQEVIDKFGRYPQRNETLGRENTPEEEAFLRDIPERYIW